MAYTVAIIGTGADPDQRDRDGYAMAYRHAPGYQRLDKCNLAACADIVPENASAFAENFDLETVYTDHKTLLRKESLDIVSVCVPPDTHTEIVVDCAEIGSLEAIHCEKPMATTWGDCQKMVEVCDQQDVQLTIDHQRRFATPVTKARRLLEEGKIGDLRRLEFSEANLFDAGTHLFDLCSYLTEDATPEWVLAGVDPDPENRWFGALNGTQAVAQWGYDDGTQGFASTAEADRPTVVDAYLRIVGEDGTIEIQPDDGPPLRMRTDGGWKTIDTGGESVYRPGLSTFEAARNKLANAVPGFSAEVSVGPSHYEQAIEHLVSALDEEFEPRISGRRALAGTELVFASWASAHRGERVELPLDIEHNPLEAICAEKFESEQSPPTSVTAETQES